MPEWMDSPVEFILGLLVCYFFGQTVLAFRYDHQCKQLAKEQQAQRKRLTEMDEKMQALHHDVQQLTTKPGE